MVFLFLQKFLCVKEEIFKLPSIIFRVGEKIFGLEGKRWPRSKIFALYWSSFVLILSKRRQYLFIYSKLSRFGQNVWFSNFHRLFSGWTLICIVFWILIILNFSVILKFSNFLQFSWSSRIFRHLGVGILKLQIVSKTSNIANGCASVFILATHIENFEPSFYETILILCKYTSDLISLI